MSTAVERGVGTQCVNSVSTVTPRPWTTTGLTVALGRVSSTEASVLLITEPLWAALLAFWLVQEGVGSNVLSGGWGPHTRGVPRQRAAQSRQVGACAADVQK